MPALTERNWCPPDTGTGVVLIAVEPSPTWPRSDSPQQYASPPVVTPQLCVAPALTDWKTSPPDAATGTVLLAVEPMPSWPPELLPQQYAARSEERRVGKECRSRW